MANKTSDSSASSPSPSSGATDSLWQPSWLHWLISALSGTVAIEKQTALQKIYDEELKRANERRAEMQKIYDEELKRANERRAEMQKIYDEELKKVNERRAQRERILAAIESKLDVV
ncbi:hypothetical protein IQ273_21100 [Nodosilinea sp. LEGE 07298]|uniref:hypothetical protein n=1 Tax=Nodosilinea sp. LEGE 07298 TaxID=2777970 RepID=UPI00187F40EE|nr:hypothetical protein [Nodosilinea sp. LEGE 07298]MBE9111908.1 hypothetical protein [Nodosilinea sp. LEGE 07298]